MAVEWASRYDAVRASIGSTAPPNFQLPKHVLWRLAVVAGDEDIQYASVQLEPGDSGATMSGHVVAFTKSNVIRAVLMNADAYDREMSEQARATFGITVSVWSRWTLLRLDLNPDGDANRNVDDAFVDLEKREYVPRLGVSLEYPAGKVELPCRPTDSDDAARLLNFIPSLLTDLSRY